MAPLIDALRDTPLLILLFVIFWPLIPLTLIVTMIAGILSAGHWAIDRIGWTPNSRRARAAIEYRRRYILPDQDFDDSEGYSRNTWATAIRALQMIQESEVVRLQIVDSAEILTVLPYHLWDIAHGLARLSEVRRQRNTVMYNLDQRDPSVLAVLEPQRRVDYLAQDDIDQRVQKLVSFADLARRADASRQREKSLRELAALNNSHYDLLAHLGGSDNELGAGGPAVAELRAVIQQAETDIRQASEAGRSLVIPDRWPQ